MWRSAAVPAFLLLLYLAGVASLLAWLTLASPPRRTGETPPSPPAAATTNEPSPPAAATAREPAPASAPAAAPPVAPTPVAPTPPAAPSPAAPAPQPEPLPIPPPPPPESAPAVPQPPAAPGEGARPAPPAETAPPPPEAAPSQGHAPAAPAPSAAPPPATAAPPPPATATAPPPALELPSVVHGPPLSPAPDPALVQDSPRGPLPVVARDGREAWRVYARPFDSADKRPRIALVIYGLGVSAAATETAIQGLPGAIALAFSPYADELGTWIGKARAAGHEVLLIAPMEPENYPESDPGPQALLTSVEPAQNVERLEWILGRATGHVGVASYMGARFTASRRHLAPILRALKSRGLMYLESRASGAARELAVQAGVPFAANAFFIDDRAARPSIDARLDEAERLASRSGHAIVMGFPYPVTLERVASWARGVESRGFALAPVSALATRAEQQ